MPIVMEADRLSKAYRLGAVTPSLDNLREVLLRGWPLRRRVAASDGAGWIWALRDVGFSIAEGDVVGVIGHNGAGKSTLLKILSGITDPTEGTVRIRGRLCSLLEVGTGFHPELTGRDNIYLNGAILGLRKAEIDARFDAIVDFAEVGAFLETPVKRYSSGMYVRLAFAVAAHLDPEILVVDEVLAVGDLAFQRKCLGKMGEVSQSGRTVIFVSHNMVAVEHLCRTVMILEQGRLVFQGSGREAIDRYVRGSAAAGPDPSAAVDLGRAPTRPGRFAPMLRRLQLATTNGTPAGAGIPVGAPFVARIGFRLDRAVAGLEVQLRFDNLLGHRILAASSAFDPDFPAEGRVGDQEVVCEIPRLTLMPGEYKLRVALLAGPVEVDVVEDAGRLTVVPSDYYGTGRMPRAGALVLEQCWRVRGDDGGPR